MLQRLLLAVMLAVAFVTQSWANVIYDVTIDYANGPRTATYSFSMEFSSPPPPTKTEADLLPSGDFSNEKLVYDGVEMLLTFDGSPFSLAFDAPPPTLSFFSSSLFKGLLNGEGWHCTAGSTQAICKLDATRESLFLLTTNAEIAQRADVPAAPTLALLGLGLAGLGWSRRKK